MPPAFIDDQALKPIQEAVDVNIDTSAVTSDSKSHSRRKRRNAWAQQTQSRSIVSAVPPLLVLGAVLYTGWRWYIRNVAHRRRGNNASKGETQANKPSNQKNATAPRKHKKSERTKQRQQQQALEEPTSAVQAIPMRSLPNPGPGTGPGPRQRPGKKNKKAHKEGKLAKKQSTQADANLTAVIAAKAKEKGIAEAGNPVDTGLVTTHNYDKTADAFHHVMQWQESGKKTFK